RLSALVPETSASTTSAIWAQAGSLRGAPVPVSTKRHLGDDWDFAREIFHIALPAGCAVERRARNRQKLALPGNASGIPGKRNRKFRNGQLDARCRSPLLPNRVGWFGCRSFLCLR